MKKFLSLLFVFYMFQTFGQTPPGIEWENNFGGTHMDTGRDILLVENNEYVLLCWTDSTDHDIQASYGGGDIWIARLTASGTLIWSKNYGGSYGDSGNSIDRSSDNGFIVAGYTYSEDIDVSQPIGNGDAWLLKLDALGNLEWEKTYGTPELPERLYDVISLPNGKYIVTGSVTVNEGTFEEETNYWVASLDVGGNMEWQQNFPGKYIQDIRRTSSGGYIMTGDDAYEKSWALLLDGQGNTLWEQNFTAINDAANFFELEAITETTDGGFVAVGSWVLFPTTEAIVLKLDASGNILWDVLLGGSGGEYLHGIHQTIDGNYILVGNSTSNDGDVSGNNGGVDIWVVKLDGTGEILWDTNLGGSQNERGNSILQTNDGKFIVLGNTFSDDGDVSDFYGPNAQDIWVVKLNSNLDISDFTKSGGIKVYPNPVKSVFTVEVGGLENVGFTFRDIRGRQIYVPRTKTNTYQFNAAALQPGVYFVTAKAGGFEKTIRILKQK